MFIFACVLLVVAGIVLFVGMRVNKHLFERREKPFPFSLIAEGIVTLAVVLLVFSPLTSVSAGSVGVPIVFGSVQERYVPEGLHLVNPMANVEQMSVRSQEYTMVSAPKEGQKEGDDSIFAQSSDGVVLQMNITIVYKLVDADAPWVYRHIGANYAESIVRPAARSAVPDSTSKFTFEEAYASKREEMANRMRDRMNESIKVILAKYESFHGTGIDVQNVLIREVHPSPELLKAIEAKMTADQQNQQMDYVLLKEGKEATRKKIEAGGIRDFQQIVVQGITPSLLEWKGIEATEAIAKSGNSKIIVIGSGKGGLPVILNPGQ